MHPVAFPVISGRPLRLVVLTSKPSVGQWLWTDTTESQRNGRQGDMKRVTLRTTKHTTTISRGETRSVTENVTRLHGSNAASQHYQYRA
jgi:hypothetical protein